MSAIVPAQYGHREKPEFCISGDYSKYFALLDSNVNPDNEEERTVNSMPEGNNAALHELRTIPLFSNTVKTFIDQNHRSYAPVQNFPQYGLLGVCAATGRPQDSMAQVKADVTEKLVFTNMNAPWSAFICGSQGSGKSHTLCCLLEAYLISSPLIGALPDPLSGMVFHFDKFTRYSSTQLCEAAHLCSSGVPIRVLVSPWNFWAMRELYTNLPGLPADAPRPEVVPLHFQDTQLNMANIMSLMAVDSGAQGLPLYLGLLSKILRDHVVKRQGAPGINYGEFKRTLMSQDFTPQQLAPLQVRLQFLESFLLDSTNDAKTRRLHHDRLWSFEPGTLTIVDLSCPFVSGSDACSLFSICLSQFIKGRDKCGRVVALDEAHKILTNTGEADNFTDELVSLICQQRHLATRTIIATQEPTLSPRLLDLCDLTIIHRFNSPCWYNVLRDHLAAVKLGDNKDENILGRIVGLRIGEALIFCPAAAFDVTDGQIEMLRDSYAKIRIRKRLPFDGVQSILASDKNTRRTTVTNSSSTEVYRLPKVDKPKAAKAQQNNDYHANISESVIVQRERGQQFLCHENYLLGRYAASNSPVTPALIEKTLRSTVRRILQQDPRTIDFGTVRSQVESQLGLGKSFIQQHKDLKRSAKGIIQTEVELFVKERKIPPPGNATWMKNSYKS